MNSSEAKKPKEQMNALAMVTIMPAYFAVINVVLGTLGLSGIASLVTALIYMAILFCILWKTSIYAKDLLMLLGIYLVFGLNYLIFPSTRREMLSQGMLILYFFFLPYAVLCFKNIRQWTGFWTRVKHHSLAVIYLVVLMMLFLPYNKFLGYMEFSYAMLPAICAMIYCAQTLREKRFFYAVSSIVGIIEMLAFGARAPAVYCLIYFFVLLLFTGFSEGGKKKLATIVLLLLGIVFIIKFDDILWLLSSFSFFKNSYIMRRFASGKLGKSFARDLIWEGCIDRIKNMGSYIGGFYGDRAYCTGVYPHNIGLEILMSWGWLLGTLILGFILLLIIRSLRTKGLYRDIAWFFIMTCFSRYMISGTYVREGKFWICMFVLGALIKSNDSHPKDLESSDSQNEITSDCKGRKREVIGNVETPPI